MGLNHIVANQVKGNRTGVVVRVGNGGSQYLRNREAELEVFYLQIESEVDVKRSIGIRRKKKGITLVLYPNAGHVKGVVHIARSDSETQNRVLGKLSMVGIVAVNTRTTHNVCGVGKGIDGIPDALFVVGAVKEKCGRFWSTLHTLPLLAVDGD